MMMMSVLDQHVYMDVLVLGTRPTRVYGCFSARY